MNPKATLVFIYNSFNDPLFQNLVFSYIVSLSSGTRYTFHIITFEQQKYYLSRNKKRELKTNLKTKGIYWYPLTFHTGYLLLLKKIYDFISAISTVLYIRFFKKTKLLFAFANVSAAISVIFSKLLGMRLLVYSYEPHSSFQVELGRWDKRSIKYKLLKKLEDYAGSQGDYILTGTKYMVKELANRKSKAKLFRAPTSVDESLYEFNGEARTRIREELGIDRRKVLLYLGKFDGLYYGGEIADFCKTISDNDSSFFFLIVTPNNYQKVEGLFKVSGISEENYYITEAVTPSEVIEYISSSDIGLIAIPPTPSQKFRSPVKTAEYLLCGLPYITCEGVSEDDIYAQEYNVGIVLQNLAKDQALNSAGRINTLLAEDKNELRKRCREVGLSYRSKSNVVKTLREIYAEVF